jgi:hypothetical protein
MSGLDAAIAAITARVNTREEAAAFLSMLGPALKRRGWREGEPLSEDEFEAGLTDVERCYQQAEALTDRTVEP